LFGILSGCVRAMFTLCRGLLSMNTKTLATIGILLMVVTLGFASTEKVMDRPPGIAADQWFPISDHLGLVIPYYQPGLDPLIDNGPIKVFPPPADTVLPLPLLPGRRDLKIQ
jgi:hypothetical protein